VINYFVRAANTLRKTDGEQRTLRKFSRRNLDLSLFKMMNVSRQVSNLVDTVQLISAVYSQLCLVGDDVRADSSVRA